jgi:DNA-binding XRE family transcriptional regulator
LSDLDGRAEKHELFVAGERLATDKGQSSVYGAGKRSLQYRCPSLTGRGRTRKADYCLNMGQSRPAPKVDALKSAGCVVSPPNPCPTVLPSDMTDNESPMAYRSINLVTGRQLRAARTLAGMTQRDLATVLAVNERAVRFWERKHDRRPTSAPNDTRIEQALWRAA